MRITSKTDPNEIRKEIVSIQERFLANVDTDLKLAAKRTAFYLMEYTLPISTSGNAFNIQNLKKRIWADVHRAYPSVGDSNWQGKAYRVMKDMGQEKKAQRFWVNHLLNEGHTKVNRKTGEVSTRAIAHTENILSDEEYFKKIRITGLKKIDDKGYSALLKSKGIVHNKTFSLSQSANPIGIVDKSRADNLALKRQKKAGLAKAAWYQSVFSLGGQRNFSASKSEEGKFVWPSEIPKLSRANPGIGSNTVTINESVAKITLTNHLRYTDHACPDHLIKQAEELSSNAMRIIFEKRARARAANAPSRRAA